MNGEAKKPFACSMGDCEMSFTSEDHLNWHQKKHDMVLNLGLANKNNEVSDQTPTPTRFIRNCEEVGLFQDLQHVNPFDETFKKAMEAKNTGSSLQTLDIPDTSNDGTLHTPHIFPPVEETLRYPNTSDTNVSSDKGLGAEQIVLTDEEGDVLEASYINSTTMNESERQSGLLDVIINNSNNNNKNVTPEDSDSVKITFNVCKDLKSKLRQIIAQKGGDKTVNHLNVPSIKINGILVSDSNRNSSNSSVLNNYNGVDLDANKSQNSPVISNEKEKHREMNRAAQQRCRKRQKFKQKKLENEMQGLREENTKLKFENKLLRDELAILKEGLIAQNKLNSLQALSNSSNSNITEKPCDPKLPTKRLRPIKPIPLKITKPDSELNHSSDNSTISTSVEQVRTVKASPPPLLPKVPHQTIILQLPANATPLVMTPQSGMSQVPTLIAAIPITIPPVAPTIDPSVKQDKLSPEKQPKKKRR